MAEPAPTRRSSRRRNAESAAPADIEVTSPEAVLDGVLGDASLLGDVTPLNDAVVLADAVVLSIAVAPLSRRAARERQRAAKADAETEGTTVEDAATADALAVPVAPDADADDTDADADAFTAACRALRAFSAAAPASDAAAAPDAGVPPAPAEQVLPAEAIAAHVAPRKHRKARKFLALGATVGVMGVAGMLAVSMTLPAEAVAAARGAQVKSATSLVAAAKAPASASSDDEIQAFVASSDLQNESIQRAEDFSTASLVDLAAERGIHYSNALYTNDPDAAIQWPFVVGVGMSFGYGPRSGRMHEGIDLVPGAGAPIQAIADGTVRVATESGGGFGVTAYIDHVIDGQVVTSHYSHMQYGSLRIVPGQTVKVGDIIGNTGNTGRSYGAHLHFEIIINGATIDPLPWMQKNAGRYDY